MFYLVLLRIRWLTSETNQILKKLNFNQMFPFFCSSTNVGLYQKPTIHVGHNITPLFKLFVKSTQNTIKTENFSGTVWIQIYKYWSLRNHENTSNKFTHIKTPVSFESRRSCYRRRWLTWRISNAILLTRIRCIRFLRATLSLPFNKRPLSNLKWFVC